MDIKLVMLMMTKAELKLLRIKQFLFKFFLYYKTMDQRLGTLLRKVIKYFSIDAKRYLNQSILNTKFPPKNLIFDHLCFFQHLKLQEITYYTSTIPFARN